MNGFCENNVYIFYWKWLLKASEMIGFLIENNSSWKYSRRKINRKKNWKWIYYVWINYFLLVKVNARCSCNEQLIVLGGKNCFKIIFDVQD